MVISIRRSRHEEGEQYGDFENGIPVHDTICVLP